MPRARRGRGEGGVYQRESDSLWVGTVSLGFDGKGKRRRKTVYGKTKAEALQKLRDLQVKSGKALDVQPGKLTVADYLSHWLENVAKQSRRPTTFERYEQVVRLHLIPALGQTRLAAFGPTGVEGLYADLRDRKTGARTIQMSGTVLGTALKHAVKRLIIPSNPVPDIPKAKPPRREPRFLTQPQAKGFLATAEGTRLYAMFLTALATGLRQGEIFGLHWGDLDLTRGTLTVRRTLYRKDKKYYLGEPKTEHSRRTIGIPADLVAALEKHRQDMAACGFYGKGKLVFCSTVGKYLEPSHVRRRNYKAIIEAANKAEGEAAVKEQREPDLIEPGIRFHDLRHTHASLLLSNGFSIKAVSARLGHASVEITLKYYAHVMPGDDERLTAGIGDLLRRGGSM